MERRELKPILESLIFAAEEPLSVSALTLILGESGVDRNQIEATLQELMQEYNENEAKGLLLREVGGSYQFVTKPNLAAWIQKLNVSKPRSLTQASLETLAIIAYRQPLVRSEIEAIRGVDSGAVLKTLLERGLIKILGRREEAGQPLIYGTTPAFLELFHLSNLEELPSMKEIEELVEAAAKPEAPAGNAEEEPTWGEDQAQESALLGFSEGTALEEDEALVDLESKMKELKTLEKEIFPKEEEKEETPPPSPETPKEPEL